MPVGDVGSLELRTLRAQLMDAERDIINLRHGSTNDQRQLAAIRGELVSRNEYIASQAKLYIAVQDENRKLRRMVRDIVQIYAEVDDE